MYVVSKFGTIDYYYRKETAHKTGALPRTRRREVDCDPKHQCTIHPAVRDQALHAKARRLLWVDVIGASDGPIDRERHADRISQTIQVWSSKVTGVTALGGLGIVGATENVR